MYTIGNMYMITAIAVTGGGLFGFDIASMSAIIGEESYKCYFNQGDIPCSGPRANVQGGITAAMPGGSWLGALISGTLADTLGRRKTIMIGPVVWYFSLLFCQISKAFIDRNQVHRLHPLRGSTKHWHAHRWPTHLWYLRWNMLGPGACLHF